jgi:hypothetical protein
MTLIIILCVVTGTVVIWCSLQGSRGRFRYVVISPLLLQDWKKQRASLVIIELRNAGKDMASEALVVPPQQLDGLLRWIPPQTTLVLCGKREFDVCRGEIEWTLLNVGVDVVYILDEDATPPLNSTFPDLATRRDLNWRA